MSEYKCRRQSFLGASEALWLDMRPQHSYGASHRSYGFDDIEDLLELAWQVAVAYAELDNADLDHILSSSHEEMP